MEIRELTSYADLALVEPLCKRTWGDDDEPENKDLLMAQIHEGAFVAGAFSPDGSRLLAYAYGFPTRDAQVQHSHRLAVDPDSRGSGLGARMKEFQREWCLARGITTIRWTYDPARLVNARLNLVRLGAVGSAYLPNYYGDMPGINAGAPSDRMMATWRIDQPRRLIRSSEMTRRVALPLDFAALLANDRAAAIEWRERHRGELAPLLDDGWEAVDVAVDSLNATAHYVLARADVLTR